jgi:phosphoribosylformylglycinamidine synthase
MAASAIDEAMRQLVAVGCSPARVALLDNFCWGNTEKPDQLGGLVRASIACYDVAKVYGAPFISGKDSLNNEFNTGKGTVSIPQTLLISAIGILDDVRKSISMDVKVPGNFVYVLGRTYLEMGGSQYYRSKGLRGGVAPRVNPVAAIKLYTKLHTAINKGFVVSAHDVSDGGLGVALAEMFFAGGYGGEIALNKAPKDKSVKRDDCLLFSESNSRFVVEVSPKNATAFEKSMKGLPFAMIGKVDGHTKLEILGLDGRTVISSDIYDLKHAWKKTIGGMMHEEG